MINWIDIQDELPPPMEQAKQFSIDVLVTDDLDWGEAFYVFDDKYFCSSPFFKYKLDFIPTKWAYITEESRKEIRGNGKYY